MTIKTVSFLKKKRNEMKGDEIIEWKKNTRK